MKALNLAQYDDPGLYLEMPDGERVVLTRALIEEKVQAMLNDPTLLAPEVRAAADYQPCDICPERETAQMCHAIMTTLPFIGEIDRYMSYDHVTAVFREEGEGSLLIRKTTMQGALQYISILSLIHYCEVGQKYSAFFEGVNPLMPQVQIADAVFRNMYLACEGDLSILVETLSTMQEELLQTAKCQVKRLQLISKRDAFLNAFVAT
ncbi:MAG: hypothetical protein QGH42_00300 [Kiritimatiellia bacterium]|jgi:hypothetical protein|nr:hypothetical protein [Pseudomonadales bacterium]MDP6490356.1 hypothetical protein [Kiritimatiellia bacterium]MDP6809508.1 hypothetical protein [Kiritimatiellia bacterium]MDP7022676.1 hypothetical protein [Kiritimatiellia bacterium]